MTVVGVLISAFYNYLLAWAAAMVKVILGRGFVMPQLSQWQMYQIFSLGALVFIFLYNGKKGSYPKNSICAKLLQYGFYVFYPVHMLILWLIRVL